MSEPDRSLVPVALRDQCRGRPRRADAGGEADQGKPEADQGEPEADGRIRIAPPRDDVEGSRT
jgi:hypothetical protein